MPINGKNKIKKISKALPFGVLPKPNSHKIIFPFYHSVSDTPQKHHKYLYKVLTTREFELSLDFLLKNYNPLTFDEVKSHLNGEKKVTKKSFFLTFDDGLREIFEVVAPILKQKGVPAAFFVNSAFVDNKNLFFRSKYSIIRQYLEQNTSAEKILIDFLQSKNIFDRDLATTIGSHQTPVETLDAVAEKLNISFADYLKTYKPYMTIKELQQLERDGFIIGGHSHNHLLFSNLPEDKQLIQTVESLKFVNQHFSPKHKLFAFPFTDFGVKQTFFEKLYKTNLVDFSFGTAGLKKDSFPKNIQRIPMDVQNSAQETLKYEYFYYFVKQFFGKNKIKR